MKILFVLLLLSFFSCTSSLNDKQFFIFNNVSFKLIEGESLIDVTSDINEHYISYFKNTNIRLPLFKNIISNSYTIYLGIPYNSSIKKIMKFQNLDDKFNLVASSSDSSFYTFKNYNNDSTYISEYSRLFDNNLIFILAISNSKTVSDSLFNLRELSNRFILK